MHLKRGAANARMQATVASHRATVGHRGRRRLRQPHDPKGSSAWPGPGVGEPKLIPPTLLQSLVHPTRELQLTHACNRCARLQHRRGASVTAAAGPTLRMESACSSDTSLKSTSCSASVPTGTAASPAGAARGLSLVAFEGSQGRGRPAPPGHLGARSAPHRRHPRRGRVLAGRGLTVCRHWDGGTGWFLASCNNETLPPLLAPQAVALRRSRAAGGRWPSRALVPPQRHPCSCKSDLTTARLQWLPRELAIGPPGCAQVTTAAPPCCFGMAPVNPP